MKISIPILAVICFSGAASVAARDLPIQFSELIEAGFEKKLKETDHDSFYQAYSRDEEMLARVRIGPIHYHPMRECIAGPAPSIKEAREKFSLYYPRFGRAKVLSGSFEWKGKRLFFRVGDQPYAVEDHHILYRLREMGIANKEDQITATLTNAVWQINEESGLQIIYLQKVALAE